MRVFIFILSLLMLIGCNKADEPLNPKPTESFKLSIKLTPPAPKAGRQVVIAPLLTDSQGKQYDVSAFKDIDKRMRLSIEDNNGNKVGGIKLYYG